MQGYQQNVSLEPHPPTNLSAVVQCKQGYEKKIDWQIKIQLITGMTINFEQIIYEISLMFTVLSSDVTVFRLTLQVSKKSLLTTKGSYGNRLLLEIVCINW